MKKISTKFILILFCVSTFCVVDAKSTYRDSLGRKKGSSEVDRYGKTTYRDAQGRIQGSKQ